MRVTSCWVQFQVALCLSNHCMVHPIPLLLQLRGRKATMEDFVADVDEIRKYCQVDQATVISNYTKNPILRCCIGAGVFTWTYTLNYPNVGKQTAPLSGW